MRRREFTLALGGAAAWPLAARAQQEERIRRIGVLMNLSANDPVAHQWLGAFLQTLQKLGWSDGRNLRVDIRWGAGDQKRYRSYAVELVALSPDVILASNISIVQALQQVTRTVPIVFAGGFDPVGSGLVASLARPGGNATGFSSSESGITGKWLSLLKEIAPNVTRVAVLFDPTAVAGRGQLRAIEEVAPSFGMETIPVDSRDGGEIDRAITAFARGANGGFIALSSASVLRHRELIIALASRYRLPAVYFLRSLVEGGGLISYGSDVADRYRLAAGYVDRILRGEKPADLPVQEAVKYELVINLKTAKGLGLEIPPALLALADEVIE